MVLKIIMDFKGQLTVARPIVSAGHSIPHIHGLLVLWSLTLQAREPRGQGGGQIRAAPLLAMGQVQGLREQLLCGSLGTLGHEFWSDSHPNSGSLPGLILGSEPRLGSLDIAVSQKPLLLPGVLPMDIPLSSF